MLMYIFIQKHYRKIIGSYISGKKNYQANLCVRTKSRLHKPQESLENPQRSPNSDSCKTVSFSKGNFIGIRNGYLSDTAKLKHIKALCNLRTTPARQGKDNLVGP